MSQRVRCYDCFRPEAHCLCGLVARVENETEVVILQHIRERAHAFNTARIAEKSLAKAEIRAGHVQDLADDRSLHARLEGFGLLYPSPSARDLSQLPEAERPTKLVVLDGTWHHARAMHRDIDALHGLPHFTLPAGLVSGFRIRKQPKSYCLSTLEAIQSALRCLEPGLPGLDDLLRPFEAMQSQHLASTSSATPRRRRPRSERPLVRLPSAFGEDFASLVVAYAELSPTAIRGMRRQLLTFAAVRPATGKSLHRVIADVPIDPAQLPLLHLSVDDLLGAMPLASVRSEWRAFLQPGDTVAAWSQSTLDVIGRQLESHKKALPMKGHYLNLRRHRGALEEIIAKENLLRPQCPGGSDSAGTRTEERLRNAAAVARLLNELTRVTEPGLPPHTCSMATKVGASVRR